MRFFFDNNMAPSHAVAFDALSECFNSSVVHLKDKFKNRAVPDDAWLASLREEGNWVVVSADKRIWTTPHLREAWRKSGLTIFFMVDSWGNLGYWDKAQWLFRQWPGIFRVANSVAAGAAYEVPRPPSQLVQLRA